MKKLCKERQEYFKIYQFWLIRALIVCLLVCTILNKHFERYKRGCIISHEQPPFLSFIRGINYLELTYVNVVTATLVLGATPQSNAK